MEVLRQTRLILILVLGPFLILLIFGIGYRNQARVLRTVFVIPPSEQGLQQEVKHYATTLGPQIDFRGFAKNEGQALADLASGKVDAVVVVPNNIEQTIKNGQQADVKLYHREIDPYQVSYVQYVAQIYVDALNRRVLRNMAAQAQKEAGSVQGDLTTAKNSAHAMRLAYEAGNAAAAQNQRQDMTQSMNSVSLGLGATLSILQGIEQNSGSSSTAGNTSDQILQLLNSYQQNNQALKDAAPAQNSTSQTDYAAQAQRAAKIESDLTKLDAQLTDFRSIDPTVLISPFKAEAVNINNIKLTSSDFFAPGVIVLLLQHLVLTFAALSIVRERTSGAMELFRVAPLTAFETLLGKYLSYLIIGTLLAAAISALVVLVLRVPMLGSWGNYALVLLALMFAALGIGFVVSMVSLSTSQAVQYAMLVLLFSIFFSGFFLDLRLLWDKIRFLAYIIPATYSMKMLQSIMFRAEPINLLLMGGLLGIGVVFFIISWFLLAREMRLR